MIQNVKDFIPIRLREVGGVWTNFVSYLENEYAYFKNLIFNLRSEIIAEQTTNAIELSNNVGAYIASGDSIDVVKQKIQNAFPTHKKLPVFSSVYKPVIDSIIGGDCSLYKGDLYYGSFIVGQSIIGSPSLIGPVDLSAGIVNAKLKGEIYIDLGLVATSDQLSQIINQLKMIVPIYFKVYVGATQVISTSPFLVGSSIIGSYATIGSSSTTYTVFQVQARIV